jgi:Phage integrase family
MRLHDVRHGYATALLGRGVHPKVVSDALGHSSASFTMDTYMHMLDSLSDAAAEAIQRAVGDAIRRSPRVTLPALGHQSAWGTPLIVHVSTGSGGGRESNPPRDFRPHTGFEDRGAHQAP